MAILSRDDTRFGSGDQPIFTEQLVDQRRFAGIGPSDDGKLQWCVGRLDIIAFFFKAIDIRHQCFEQVGHSLAMLRADCDTFAKAQRKGIVNRVFGLFTFDLVDHKDDGFVAAAQPAGDFLIERRYACPAVDDEQGDSRTGQCRLGLLAHPPRQRGRILIFISSGIDNPEFEVEKLGIALTPVARHSRLVINQRDLLADKAVEERGFADIRTSNNRD